MISATCHLTSITTGAQSRRQQVQPLPLQGRLRRLRCRAEGGSGSAPAGGQTIRDEVLARINKAKGYKKSQQPPQQVAPAAQLQPTGPAPAAAAQPGSFEPGSGADVEKAFNQAAKQLAAKEEADFLQAVSEAASASRSSGGGSGGPGSAAQPASSSMGAGTAGQAAAGRDAILARINAAKQYKQQPAGTTNGGSSSSASGPGSPAAAAAAASMHPPPTPPAAPTAQPSASQLEAEQQRSFRTGAGGADQAANWLVFADKSGSGAAQQIDQGLSAEQFTLAKEELKKQQEVEIITVDAAYAERLRRQKQQEAAGGSEGTEQQATSSSSGDGMAAGEAEGDELHKPKVATWGVFPRPRNISEAYGGGRNLRPGQELETPEQAAERQQRVSTALQQYRKSLGLDIDPAVEAEAQESYDQGQALFNQGLITSALPKFAAAAEAMSIRSRLGGEARLQQAICLDSLGRNQEAYDIYKRIENHPAPGVAKKAKRMLFGWKAAENLKTTRLSYTPTTAQWKRYFDAFNRNAAYAGYVASEDEGAGQGGPGEVAAAVVATSVVLLPLAFVAYKVLVR